jgi:DNA processing protein
VKKLDNNLPELGSMKSYPKELYFSGNKELLNRVKISIVGSRKTSKYAREFTHKLSSALSKAGVCVVSGGAMGVDAVAHLGAGSSNTIAVLPCGIDVKYPSVNKNLLSDIEKNGLLMSQFAPAFRATPWSFVVRNELVVALGDVLVVAEAELGSGSMRSDVDEFVSRFGVTTGVQKNADAFLDFCETSPTYEEALAKFPDRVFEAELSGVIEIRNAKVFLL